MGQSRTFDDALSVPSGVGEKVQILLRLRLSLFLFRTPTTEQATLL